MDKEENLAKLFDPLVLITPVVVNAKNIIQELSLLDEILR